MKKLFFSLALLSVLFTACKKDVKDQIIGKWKHETITLHEVKFKNSASVDDKTTAADLVDKYVIPYLNREMYERYFEFRKGGVVNFSDGGDIDRNFTYSIDNDILAVKFGETTTMSGPFSVSDTRLSWTTNAESMMSENHSEVLSTYGVTGLTVNWTFNRK